MKVISVFLVGLFLSIWCFAAAIRYEIEIMPKQIVVKQDGQPLKSVENNETSLQYANTIKSLINDIKKIQDETQSTVATLRSMGMDDQAKQTEEGASGNIQMFEKTIAEMVSYLQ